MSIIVKGEPMPEACAFCPCFRDDSIDGVHAYQCKATFITYGKEDDWIWNTRPNWCPLVELPEKHGRLIDADAFAERIKSIIERQGYDDLTIGKFLTVGDVLNAVIADLKGMTLYGYEHTPTVIEAEGAEE